MLNGTILNDIAQFGFPIVISIYLLVRMEGKIESLTNSINDLNHGITSLNKDKN